ncbi:MAG: hypothetical protein M3373_13645, partial [Gemmatimonadota bacterium]|nr:hypothetical protein [Gemmatimonadota bacterium]
DQHGAWDVFRTRARVVVVLHQHMWGRTPTTRDDAAAIRQRVRAGGKGFLQVVSLDRTPLPEWLENASSCSVLDCDLDDCVDRIVEAVAARGGATRPVPAATMVARAAADEQTARERDTFLGSYRATSALGREFDRLADEVARQAAALGPVADGAVTNGAATEVRAEVRRAPGRCTVQLGPVALSLSWIRSHFDSVAEGRLLIIEWAGTIGRGAAPGGGVRATPIREDLLRAEATRADDWQWRSNDTEMCAYGPRELAARCLDSLVCALGDRSR